MRKLTRALPAAILAAIMIPATVLAVWPVASLSSYVSQWSHRGHVAIDIAATGGTKVVPARGGTVVFAGWRNNCGGYQVWVKHPNGIYSAYYHLKAEIVSSGQWVDGGVKVIGYVGHSGCATGNHVHVEVWSGFPWRSGSYRVNPWRYIDEGAYLPYRYR